MRFVEPIQRKMYPFNWSSPIVDYDDVGTESEDIEPRAPIILSAHSDGHKNTVEDTIAWAVVTAVDANDVVVTDCYQAACEGRIAVTSTTGMRPDVGSFVKCNSVVKERQNCRINEADGAAEPFAGVGIQSSGGRSVATDEIASRDADGSVIDATDNTNCRIKDGTSPSLMAVTRSRSAERRLQQQEQQQP